VKRVLPVLFRATYTVLITACLSFVALHFAQRTDWYKKYLYKQLLAGNETQQLRAASTLVHLGGQQQLLDAIRADQPSARAVARKALEYLWFNAGGPEAYRLTQAAYDASEQREFEKALALLNTLIAKFPRFAEGWNQRASVFWQLGEYEKSINDSQHALALNPNHYGAWQGIGVCRLKQGDVRDACRCLRAALKILPYDEPTRDALKSCEELLRKNPPARQPQVDSQVI
jgi:tetratricopeptide (TPR) repeat protein